MPDHTLERFRPTVGRWIGVAGLALLALVAVAVASTGFDRTTVLVLLGAALLAVLTWASLVRPTVHARQTHLMLRNAWTQKDIPWARVDDVDVRQTLLVTSGDRVHHGIAIGKSARKILRGDRGSGSMFGSASSREFAERPTLEGSDVVGTDYADYVVLKIESYASLHADEGRGDVERHVQWPLVVLTVGLLVAFVVVLVVG